MTIFICIFVFIYRFLKTIGIPFGVSEKFFFKWQEAKRKSIERAFGVLQIKFQCLQCKCRKHSVKDAEDMILASTILHNQMVDHRVERDEVEDPGF